MGWYVNDRPILRAAIYANADILLTGDKDFLDPVCNILKLYCFRLCTNDVM